MYGFAIKRNDVTPSIEIQVVGPDGTVVDLTGGTARFIMRRAGEAAKVSATATITDAVNGIAKYDWTDGDTDTVGSFLGEFEFTFGSETLTVPNDPEFPFIEIEVLPDLDGELAGGATAPSTCTLFGVLFSGGSTLAGALVRLRISPGLAAAAGTGFHTSAPLATYTSVDGYWQIVVPQGEDFRIEIPAAGVDAIGTVPASDTANINTLTLSEYRGSAIPSPARWI